MEVNECDEYVSGEWSVRYLSTNSLTRTVTTNGKEPKLRACFCVKYDLCSLCRVLFNYKIYVVGPSGFVLQSSYMKATFLDDRRAVPW